MSGLWKDACVQVLVDISTPAATFDCVDAAVAAHTAANPNDFTGKHLVVANNANDPLKFMLCVWWEYCHQGENHWMTPVCYIASLLSP